MGVVVVVVCVCWWVGGVLVYGCDWLCVVGGVCACACACVCRVWVLRVLCVVRACRVLCVLRACVVCVVHDVL